MNMEFLRKLPTPLEIKNLYPLSEELMEVNGLNTTDVNIGQLLLIP